MKAVNYFLRHYVKSLFLIGQTIVESEEMSFKRCSFWEMPAKVVSDLLTLLFLSGLLIGQQCFQTKKSR